MQLQFLTAVQVSWTPYLHRSKAGGVNGANGSVFSTKQIRAQWICLWKGKTTGNLYGQLPSAAFRQSIHPWSAKCATVFSACSGCHVLNMLQDLSLCKFLLIFFLLRRMCVQIFKFWKIHGFCCFWGWLMIWKKGSIFKYPKRIKMECSNHAGRAPGPNWSTVVQVDRSVGDGIGTMLEYNSQNQQLVLAKLHQIKTFICQL